MGRADAPGKGWFDIKGEQQGDRTLQEQMTGLEFVVNAVPGKTVLDLGCAEGLISLELMKAGAAEVCGVEIVPNRVATAHRLFAGHRASFRVMDLDNFAAEAANMPRFDIVLALAIAHKLRQPEAFLLAAAGRCRELMAVRSTRVWRDRRSKFREINVPRLMASAGLALVHEAAGPRDEWVMVYARQRPAEAA